MTTRLHHMALIGVAALATGCATCGPGTVQTDGAGWRFERDSGGILQNNFGKVCLPVSPVTDCTEFQMVEEDGGGWRIDRDGGGFRIDRDGGGYRIDRDGGGYRKERDEPHHPGDAGKTLRKIVYVPSGVCRVGVSPPA